MNNDSPKDLRDTVRLLRPPPRVYTEARGQTVWMGEVEVLDFELEGETTQCDPYNSA